MVADEPVPPRQLNAKAPRDLETICLKCLQKAPSMRYASAEALAEDLRRWQQGEPIQARPVRAPERLVKWVRRRPAIAGLLAAIVLLTAAALVLTTTLYRNAAREALRAEQAEKRRQTDRDHAREQELAAQQEKGRAQKQLTRAEGLLYASQIQAALSDWEMGNVSLAWDYLDACRWDYRGLEHRYLCTLFNQNQVTLRGHKGRVGSVAISPAGDRFVSGSADGTVKVWDAAHRQGAAHARGARRPRQQRRGHLRRRPHCQWKRGQHGQGVGCVQRRGAAHPDRARRRRLQHRGQHRWPLDREQRRPRPEGVGRAHRQGAAHPRGALDRRQQRRDWQRRTHHRQRQLRHHREGVGRAHRQEPAHAEGARIAGEQRGDQSRRPAHRERQHG